MDIIGVQGIHKSSYHRTLRLGLIYSKTCVKRPLKNRQNKDLYDK